MLWAQCDLPQHVPGKYLVYQWVLQYRVRGGTERAGNPAAGVLSTPSGT